jgi:uncharacterized protein YdeI (YjbR/CyaY-like superfamily)
VLAVAAELPVVSLATQDAWAAWLDKHHATSEGVWLAIAKKRAATRSVTYAEAVEVALCYGWIDGQGRPHDEHAYLQKFTPRRVRSKWSKINRARAEALIASGRMEPAGMRAVESAKADGRWDAAYDSPRTANVPADLEAALDANDAARQFFTTLSSQNRYAILYRIADAKTAETRARRIAQFVSMLADHKTLH